MQETTQIADLIPLIAKLYAYGYEINDLKLVKPYLTDRWQRTKIIFLLVPGQNCFWVCLKARFWDPSYLIYI